MTYVETVRKRLTSHMDFWCDPNGDDTTGDGLSPATAMRQPNALYNKLAAEWDLGGKNVRIKMRPAYDSGGLPTGVPVYYDRIYMVGKLVGQAGPLIFENASTNTRGAPIHIRGNGTGFPSVEMSYGAQAQFLYCTFDSTFQFGVPQDNIILGKGASIALKNSRFYGNLPAPRNHITLAERCDIDFMRSYVWVAGDCQCFLSMDQLSTGYWHTDGQANLMAMGFEDSPGLGRRTRFWTSFIRIAGQSNLNMQNIDYHGWANGTWDGFNPGVSFGAGAVKVILQDRSALDLNGLGLSSLPGGSQGSTVSADSVVK
jgi:hypothetical protein